MKGHFGAVLTSGVAALAVVMMVLCALVIANPASAERTASDAPASRAIPWTPAPRTPPASERDVKPREHHRAPPRNNRGGGFFPDAPRAPRRAAA